MFLPKTEGDGKFLLMGPPAFPQSIFIESHRIEACIDYAVEKHMGRIAISPLEGFRLPDLYFLSRFPWIEHITIMHSEMLDISAIATLHRLQYLQMGGRPKQQLDLENFPLLRELRVDWWPKLQFGDALASIRVLSLGRYTSINGNLSGLPEMPNLYDLDLVQSRSPTLSGLERFRGLRKLTVSYFPHLTDISMLSTFKDGILEILEFEKCPKLEHHDGVRLIQSLRRLAFNHCGEIRSLKFLNELSLLESFSFVGTNIIDGDLAPCLRLQFAGFLDRRHYSHRRADFPAPTAPTTLVRERRPESQSIRYDRSGDS